MNWLQFNAKGASAMSETLDVDAYIVIHEVRLHLSAAGGTSENFEVVFDSELGSEYDTVFDATDMETASDRHWQPTRPVKIGKNDTVDFTYTNTGSKTWGLEVLYEVV